MPLLPPAQILRLHAAIVSAGRTGSRAALLAGLDARLVAELPATPDESTQILGDITELNRIERLPDGGIPLLTWLEAAAKLTEPSTEAAFFRETATILGAAKPPPPVISARHQLRAPPADFTGREEDLKDLLEKIGAKGVSLSAREVQGGIGKTALALKLAKELAPRCPDAQIDIDLKGTGPAPLSPAAVMAQVIHAFRPTTRLPDGEAEIAALYRAVLTDQRVLLVLDNARDAAQVEPLLPPPGGLVIVTSRHVLALPDVYARNLDKLSPPDAVAMLQRLAPRIDAGGATVIAALCAYMPLTLRLAGSALAVRVKLEPGEYVEKLEAAQAKLERVYASLRVSLDMLDARMQTFWACLGVFPGDFDREAAAAVGELDPVAARKAVGGLLKYGLLDYDPVTKRCRLHDLARFHAISQLEGAPRCEAERRHAAYFTRVIATANQLYKRGGPGAAGGLARFDLEWANIEAGQAWAAARAAEDDDAATLCSATPDAGTHCLHLRQHPRDRIRWREAALAAAQRLGRRDAEGVHLGNLGLAYLALGEPRRAVEVHEQQVTIARELGDRRAEVLSLGNLGIALMDLGEPQRAIEAYEQYLTIIRELGDRRGECSALGNLGVAYAKLGESRRAIELYKQQRRIAREIGDKQGEASACWNCGLRYEALGELEKAIGYLQICVDFERAVGLVDAEKDARHVEALRALLSAPKSESLPG